MSDDAEDYSHERFRAEVLRLEDEREKREAANRPQRFGRIRAAIAREIRENAAHETLDLRLGGDVLARVRPGGIVTLLGASGRGKTSLAATIAVEHARDVGPSVVLSLELPAHEFGARVVGIRTDTQWMQVLEGGVDDERMIDALPERLSIIDRNAPTIAAVEAEVDALRSEYPNQPILVVFDYVQLLEVEARPGEPRTRVAAAMKAIDAVARGKRIVALVLTQGSRASARALAGGDVRGSQTTDGGAESAAIEQWASVTLAIGEHASPSEDGSCASSIEVGKGRMLPGGGDASIPARYYARSGLWRLTGDARPASDVRAEKQTKRDEQGIARAKLAIGPLLANAAEPMSRRDITNAIGGRDEHNRAAVTALLQDETSGVVEVGPPKRGHYAVWNRDRAVAARRQVRLV